MLSNIKDKAFQKGIFPLHNSWNKHNCWRQCWCNNALQLESIIEHKWGNISSNSKIRCKGNLNFVMTWITRTKLFCDFFIQLKPQNYQTSYYSYNVSCWEVKLLRIKYSQIKSDLCQQLMQILINNAILRKVAWFLSTINR